MLKLTKLYEIEKRMLQIINPPKSPLEKGTFFIILLIFPNIPPHPF
jgi:hypothetical protein